MLGPSKTTEIRRLTPEQLAHVFQAPKKREVLKEGLYNERGAKILKDQVQRERRRNTKRLYTEAELRKMQKLQEEKKKLRKRDLLEDYWFSMWSPIMPGHAGTGDSAGGGNTGQIGSFTIGLDFEIP